MRTLLTLLLSLSMFSGAAMAAPVELACTWKAPAFLSSDPGSREAAKFFVKPTEPAYFRIDIDAGKVENADPHKTQSIVFPFLQLNVEPEQIKIQVPDPNMAGVKGRQANIHVAVNRFTLQSTLVLEMPEKQGGRSAIAWLREGVCVRKAF